MKNKTIKLYDNPENNMPFSNESGLLKWYGNQASSLRRAFEISINKWQIIVQNNPPVYGEGSSYTCGLCHLYFQKDNCGDCPIATAGHVLCTKTPYEDWHKMMSCENAQAELDFLIDLAREHGFKIEEVHDGE